MYTQKIIVVLFYLFFTKPVCEEVQVQENEVKIRTVNNSDYALTRVSMFSTEFGDLKPKDSTEYKPFEFDPLSDDSLIYCIYKGIHYARYIPVPNKGAGHYTYSIDSLKNRIIYVSMRLE